MAWCVCERHSWIIRYLGQSPLLAALRLRDFYKNTLPVQVMVFSWLSCPFCKRAKALLDDLGVKYKVLELDQMGKEGSALRAELAKYVLPSSHFKHLDLQCLAKLFLLMEVCTSENQRADNHALV